MQHLAWHAYHGRQGAGLGGSRAGTVVVERRGGEGRGGGDRDGGFRRFRLAAHEFFALQFLMVKI